MFPNVSVVRPISSSVKPIRFSRSELLVQYSSGDIMRNPTSPVS